jgi:hypothetical protein
MHEAAAMTSPRLLRHCFLSSLALCAIAPAALADDVPASTDAPAGQYASLRGVQGPKGMFSAQVLLNINLTKDLAGEPISLSPDLYYAFSDKLQLGLLHQGPLGWQNPGIKGTSLCLTGDEKGCPELYNNVGFDLMYGLLFGKTDLSLHGSLFIDSIDPMYTTLAIGLSGKHHINANVALLFDPKVAIALNHREIDGMEAANEDVLYVPLELGYQVGAPNLLKLLVAVYGPLDGFGDAYRIPVGVGYIRNLTEHIDLGLRFSFDNLLGETGEAGRADERSLAVLFNFRS